MERGAAGTLGTGEWAARPALHGDYPGGLVDSVSRGEEPAAAAVSGCEMGRPELSGGATVTWPDHIFFPKTAGESPAPRDTVLPANAESREGDQPVSWPQVTALLPGVEAVLP